MKDDFIKISSPPSPAIGLFIGVSEKGESDEPPERIVGKL